MMTNKPSRIIIAIFISSLLMQISITAIYADTSQITTRAIATGLGYDQVYEYSEGLAKVEKDGKFGFIDIKGNLTIPLSYTDVQSFSDGLAVVVAEASGLLGYIDFTI